VTEENPDGRSRVCCANRSPEACDDGALTTERVNEKFLLTENPPQQAILHLAGSELRVASGAPGVAA
jgi:hypothetical protein